MYSDLNHFLEDMRSKTIEEQKMIINEMIDALNFDQLSQVINFLKEPFFTNKLNDYLLDSTLPDIKSKEFLFLVQAAKYNGNIVRKFMNEAGISNYYLDKFIDKYQLKKISSGMYIFPHIEKNANHYMKICDGLYNNNKSLIISYPENDPILLTRNAPIDSAQIVLKKTMNNNLVRVTSAEKTIADVLAPNSTTEEEVKYEAIKKYYDLHPRDSKRLRRVAQKQGILKVLDKYLWELKLD